MGDPRSKSWQPASLAEAVDVLEALLLTAWFGARGKRVR